MLEPILCCRLFLSTYDAVSGANNITSTAPPERTRPGSIEMNNLRQELDSFGYPSARQIILCIQTSTELTIPALPQDSSAAMDQESQLPMSVEVRG
jgi:hypothetical protein